MLNTIAPYSESLISKADNTSFSFALRDFLIVSAFCVSTAFSASF